MMLSCKEATELASRSLDRKLPWPQRLSLRLHLLICHRCRHYINHLFFMQRIATKIEQHIEKGQAVLPPQARQKIGARLQQQNHSS